MADHRDDLVLGELAAEGRHDSALTGDVGTALAVRVAVDLDAGGVVALGAVVHVADLVLDVSGTSRAPTRPENG